MLPAAHDEADWEAVVEDDAVVRPADRRRSLGLAEPRVEQVPAFLDSVRHGDGRSLLHTEVMREHPPEPPEPALESMAATWFGAD